MGASPGILTGWLNRKKPSVDNAETSARTRRTDAETRKIEVDASKTLSDMAAVMSAQVMEAYTAMEGQRKRHVSDTEYFQKQTLHRQEQEESARERAHDTLDELNRAVRAIKEYEVTMAKEDIQFVPFVVKTFKEITEE